MVLCCWLENGTYESYFTLPRLSPAAHLWIATHSLGNIDLLEQKGGVSLFGNLSQDHGMDRLYNQAQVLQSRIGRRLVNQSLRFSGWGTMNYI